MLNPVIKSIKPYIIKSTSKTPAVKFDIQEGTIEIKGVSIPEAQAASEFYAPIIETISKYSAYSSFPLTINIYLDYFNTASSKYILYIFRVLEIIYSLGNKVTINWYYEDNNAMYMAGVDYKSLLKLPFNIQQSTIVIEL